MKVQAKGVKLSTDLTTATHNGTDKSVSFAKGEAKFTPGQTTSFTFKVLKSASKNGEKMYFGVVSKNYKFMKATLG